MNAILAGILQGAGLGGQALAEDRKRTEDRALKQQALDLEREKMYEDPTAYAPLFKAIGLPDPTAGAVGPQRLPHGSMASIMPALVAQQKEKADRTDRLAASQIIEESGGRPPQPTSRLAPGEDPEAGAFVGATPSKPPMTMNEVRGALAKTKIGPAIFKDMYPQDKYATSPQGIFHTGTGEVTTPNTPAPEPPAREGYQRTYHQDAQGRSTYSDALKPPTEKESAITDWIATNQRLTKNLSPQAARDLARQEIDKRTVTTRVEINQPGLTTDAVDRAADYVNQTGQLPANLGFGNPRLRAQILDRAAQRAKETGGDLGLAAQQANFKANQAELTKLQTQRGPVVAFMRTAEDHLKRAEQLSATVDRTEIPVLNRWLLSGQTNWTGNPATAQFAAVTKLATTEVAKVISSATGSGGVVSDAARKEVDDVLRPAFATGQFSAVAQALRGLMHDRASGYQAQIDATNARLRMLGGGAPSTAPGAAVKWGRDAQGRPVPLP